ncbi:MAG: Peptidyl-prolyl cis-trans isomerase (rotamase) - cyclophilin family [Candidatus Doudnabacteria bacterium]|nr:Peptidyl-prolyl cis-trans isomerase (rotamase) - cyclophilin family [Candidatus Doudnabacteria bacterium]
MNSKFIYALIGLIIFLGGGIIIYSVKHKTADSPAPAQTNNQTSQTSEQSSANNTSAETNTNTNSTTNTGDKNMTDATAACSDASQKDANGNFKPSVDISNKVVTLDTTMGKIQLQMFDKDAPKTVQNFVCLSEKGYYNNVKFHRVAHGFVIQAGDPTGTGSGGESVYGGKFEDELNPNTPSYKAGYVKGTLAMANAGPNTNGSQFFIMISDVDIPHNYTIFGKVIAGMDVVDKIGSVPIDPVVGPDDGSPKTPIVINKATVTTVK